MPTTKQTAALLIALMTFCSADVSQAGLFNWWRRPAPQPTTVGYYPATGVYQGAGPAASYYTSNYAPNYQAVNYPPANYPPANYRATNYPPANYGAANYPPASYQPVAPGLQPAPPRTVARAPSYNTVYRAPLNGAYAAPATTFYRAPRTTYYRAPTTTYYRAAQPTAYAPASFYAPTTSYYAPRGYTNYQPVTAYQPVQAAPPQRSWFGGLFRWGTACDGTSTCRPYTATTVNYANPQTNYRPSWQRVPVTYYRPVTSVDPVTGQSVQRMQPCTTYRWQIQQRPTMIPQHSRPVTQPSVPCEGTPTLAAPPQSGSSSRTDDYYNRSRIIPPSDGGLVPKDAEIIRDERVPADERPRLQGNPPAPETGSLGRTTTRRTASTRPQPAGESNDDASTRPGLMLDPNGDRNIPQPPPLMSPHDKTAAYRAPLVQRVAYQAQWPHAKPKVRRATQTRQLETPSFQSEPTTRPMVRRQPTRRLDDSGWRSLRD